MYEDFVQLHHLDGKVYLQLSPRDLSFQLFPRSTAHDKNPPKNSPREITWANMPRKPAGFAFLAQNLEFGEMFTSASKAFKGKDT